MEKNLFQEAARKQFRFKTVKGLLNVEKLFELNFTELDQLYIDLKSQVSKEQGLLNKKNVDSIIQNKLELVKEVFETLKEEKDAKVNAIKKSEFKKEVLEQMRENDKEEFRGKSNEELAKMLDKMD